MDGERLMLVRRYLFLFPTLKQQVCSRNWYRISPHMSDRSYYHQLKSQIAGNTRREIHLVGVNFGQSTIITVSWKRIQFSTAHLFPRIRLPWQVYRPIVCCDLTQSTASFSSETTVWLPASLARVVSFPILSIFYGSQSFRKRKAGSVDSGRKPLFTEMASLVKQTLKSN